MKKNYYLIFGVIWIISVTVETITSVGELAPAHTYDWTLPLYSLWFIGGTFLVGYLAGKFNTIPKTNPLSERVFTINIYEAIHEKFIFIELREFKRKYFWSKEDWVIIDGVSSNYENDTKYLNSFIDEWLFMYPQAEIINDSKLFKRTEPSIEGTSKQMSKNERIEEIKRLILLEREHRDRTHHFVDTADLPAWIEKNL